MLHPGFKLDYFRVQEWEADWINEAEILACKKYEDSYKGPEILDIDNDKVSLVNVPDQIRGSPNS